MTFVALECTLSSISLASSCDVHVVILVAVQVPPLAPKSFLKSSSYKGFGFTRTTLGQLPARLSMFSVEYSAINSEYGDRNIALLWPSLLDNKRVRKDSFYDCYLAFLAFIYSCLVLNGLSRPSPVTTQVWRCTRMRVYLFWLFGLQPSRPA